jgi:hypothetical protein
MSQAGITTSRAERVKGSAPLPLLTAEGGSDADGAPARIGPPPCAPAGAGSGAGADADERGCAFAPAFVVVEVVEVVEDGAACAGAGAADCFDPRKNICSQGEERMEEMARKRGARVKMHVANERTVERKNDSRTEEHGTNVRAKNAAQWRERRGGATGTIMKYLQPAQIRCAAEG